VHADENICVRSSVRKHYMRAINRFLRVATTAWCIGFFFLPAHIRAVAALGLFFAVGFWSLLYPPGLLGWARTAHFEIDPTNKELWWVPRVIGAGFVAISILGVLRILGGS
jgi:hypothetical protein